MHIRNVPANGGSTEVGSDKDNDMEDADASKKSAKMSVE